MDQDKENDIFVKDSKRIIMKEINPKETPEFNLIIRKIL